MAGEANALIAICHERPANLGHVGWGYEYPDGTWCVGAIEATLFENYPNGFWQRRAKSYDDAINYFRKMQERYNTTYNEFKYLTANGVPNWKAADIKMDWVRQQPYNVFGRNCMNSTFDILCSFSQGGRYSNGILPKPENNWLPNDWYEKVPYSARYSFW